MNPTRSDFARLASLFTEIAAVCERLATAETTAPGSNRKVPRTHTKINDVDVAIARQEMRRLGIVR